MARKRKLLLAEEADIVSILPSETLILATAAQYDGAVNFFLWIYQVKFSQIAIFKILTDL